MRLNNSYSFTSLLISALIVSSCSRATYSEKAKELTLAPRESIEKNNSMDLELNQSLEMSEGEIKTFKIRLAEAALADTTVSWSLHNEDIKPADRFKQTEGSASIKAGEQEIVLEIPAQEIDPRLQGDQIFTLLLMAPEAKLNAWVSLKLIDIVITAHRTTELKTDLKMNFQLSSEQRLATLSLNEKSEEDIIVDIETQDQTAIALKDYTPIKKTIVIPSGQTSISVPYEILAKPCRQEKSFIILIKNVSGAEALAKEVKVVIPADSEVSCNEAKTKRKPKATWN